jgi:MFS family permease
MSSLVTGVALTNTSMAGASTAATLIGAQELTETWSGIPNAAGVLGTAAGTLGLSALLARRGSRLALSLGYLAAVTGAVVAVVAVARGSVPLLVAGMILLGLGNGGAQLSRYCAADLYPTHRRGLVIGVVVWTGTIGAIAGPNLLAPSVSAAQCLGLPGLGGPFLVALLAAAGGLAASLLLPALRTEARRTATGPVRLPAEAQPSVVAALVAMVCGQLAMVALMTMTPVEMSGHQHGLGSIGIVLSAHLVGMFALAPLSGHLADRAGGRVVVLLGVGVLVLSVLTAVLSTGLPSLTAALFLLGWGWNLTFVGGSGLLAVALTDDQRIAVQGRVDALVWGSSALGSVGAGAVLAGGGFTVLAISAGVVALASLLVLRTRERTGVRVR